jgi:hypothetical protein
MSCPFFLPSERTSIADLPHPERLPLGDCYAGHCTAANVVPTEAMLHDCNLGYAKCVHLPADRASDAVRFSIRRDAHGSIAIQFVCEAAHAPVAQGTLVFDPGTGRWREQHEDARIQRMAECRVASMQSAGAGL